MSNIKQIGQRLNSQFNKQVKLNNAPPALSNVKGGDRRKRSRRRRPRSNWTKSIPYRRSVPNPKNYISARTTEHGCEIYGTDFLQNVTLNAAGINSIGQLLVNVAINPNMMPLSRLRMHAHMYDMYKFKSLEFQYIPSVAVMDGSILGYFDPDPMDNPIGYSAQSAINKAESQFTSKTTPVTNPITWKMYNPPSRTELFADYTSIDPRWTDAGRFVLLLKTTCSTTTFPTTLGTIKVKYHVEFENPQLDNNMWGYAAKWTGSGSMTPAVLWGSPVFATWNNMTFDTVPLASSGTFKLTSGAYMFAFASEWNLLFSSGAVTLTNEWGTAITPIYEYSKMDNDNGMYICQFSNMSTSTTVTVTIVGTGTINSSTFYVMPLPVTALSTKRRAETAITEVKNLSNQMIELLKTMPPEEEEKSSYVIVKPEMKVVNSLPVSLSTTTCRTLKTK